MFIEKSLAMVAVTGNLYAKVNALEPGRVYTPYGPLPGLPGGEP